MPPALPHSSARSLRALCFALIIALLPIGAAAQSNEVLPLDQVRPGMQGYAYTIFAGDQVEKFDLEVIGVMPNFLGPKQSIILVQLKGPKVEHTGVVAGMSGSPVYIDGKLVGALSLKFGVFVKEPLAGVTPIADMLALPTGDPQPGGVLKAAGPASGAGNWSLGRDVAAASQRYLLPDNWAQAAGVSGGGAYLEPIAAPLTFSGFAPAAIRQYAGDWLSYGMVAAPGGVVGPQPDDAKIVAGDMVSMILVQGDLSISVACSVTAITDDRVYMCGHP